MPRWLSRAGRAPRRDRGESLIEVLLSVTIMSIAVVAVVGALATAVRLSDVHRKQATANVLVRDIAERLQTRVIQIGYDDFICSGDPLLEYSPAQAPELYEALSLPEHAGFDATVDRVLFWHPEAEAFENACPDVGVQLVTVRVSQGDVVETLDVVVRKPCRTEDAPC